jgi:hypothetical protein
MYFDLIEIEDSVDDTNLSGTTICLTMTMLSYPTTVPPLCHTLHRYMIYMYTQSFSVRAVTKITS